ncbi:MAG: MBL fold metallo-hydrolase [Erysipelotrichaceae bacterium]|nr:MBL fold metallo-hydrolase [Erysipelotrichaceae bacterium]
MKIEINCHSSIRITADKTIYFDPFKIEEECHDADIIFITHDHYDHFSIEDIKKIEKDDTVYVIPECMYNMLGGENVIVVEPGEKTIVEGFETFVVPAYNKLKPFHPKMKGYVGYNVLIEGKRVYVAGDTDMNEDNVKLKCDIALVPVGGKYTMDYKQAAELVNLIKPEIAIPTHYGDIVGDKNDGEKFIGLLDPEIKGELKIA